MIWIAAGFAVLALTTGSVRFVQREKEWAHGGDALTVQVEVALADLNGRFNLVMFDKRVAPPTLMDGLDAWSAAGLPRGSGGGSGYRHLAGRYDWLQGFGQSGTPGVPPLTYPGTPAVDAGSGASGSVTAVFHRFGENFIPFSDPSREVMVALVHFADGEDDARWARRIYG